MWEWKCRSAGWFVSSQSWGSWQRFSSAKGLTSCTHSKAIFVGCSTAWWVLFGGMESHESTKHLSRCLPDVHQEALAWAVGALSTHCALHSNTSGAWLPSYFCPMPTVHGSLLPWAPWNTSLLLQPLKCYLNSCPWPQTSALHPFLPQCPTQCLVPCQKLPWMAFRLAGQGAKEAKLMTPVHMH